MRLRLSLVIAGWAGSLSKKLLGKSGETIPGKILLKLHPKALAQLASGRSIVLVSGTNGKTSTTKVLSEIISILGQTISNRTGSNLDRGCATTLMSPSEYAVLEVDELYLPMMIATTKPQVVLLLNLTRDQLHRMHEVKRVATRWADAVKGAPQTMFVGDIDDPFVSFALLNARKSIRVSFGGRRHPDGAACPACGSYLTWIGNNYSCRCGLDNQRADKLLALGTAAYRNSELANIAGGAMGCPRVEIDNSQLERSFIKEVAGVTCKLRLVKNPASWSEALAGIDSDGVILILNARQVDGIDTSWIWDISFEALRGKKISVCGERAIDLSYRLHVAGIENNLEPSFEVAVTSHKDSPSVDVLAAYTAFFAMASQ